jgi:hypothetical protein
VISASLVSLEAKDGSTLRTRVRPGDIGTCRTMLEKKVWREKKNPAGTNIPRAVQIV